MERRGEVEGEEERGGEEKRGEEKRGEKHVAVSTGYLYTAFHIVRKQQQHALSFSLFSFPLALLVLSSNNSPATRNDTPHTQHNTYIVFTPPPSDPL